MSTAQRLAGLLCLCVHAPVCVYVCVSIPLGLICLPPTCKSAGVWLIWAEVVVTSWTGVDFLSSPNTDLVFIISSVSCLYVFIDQRCYGWWYEGRGDGSGSERRRRNDRKKKSLKLERVLLFLSVFVFLAHINLQADRADAATQEKCQLSDWDWKVFGWNITFFYSNPATSKLAGVLFGLNLIREPQGLEKRRWVVALLLLLSAVLVFCPVSWCLQGDKANLLPTAHATTFSTCCLFHLQMSKQNR